MRKFDTNKMVGLALFTAIVVVLQLLGAFIKFGMFSVSLVLVPIVVGAAMFGPLGSMWLGFVFGVTVLLSGDANAFMTINPAGTVITVLAKGALAGLFAGLVYRLIEKKNTYVAVIAAAIVCPVVNSGIFFLGCVLFFLPAISEWAAGGSAINYIIFG
ncbi:MAG: ECF transporter S component, partial [Clostridiales bacterium]|nr:ECF transporter S component [Clostridiales bacterium]